MATKIQLRRDTATNWTAQNPILSEGEIGYDSTNKTLKVGDGTTAWSTLPTIQSGGGGSVDLSDYATIAYVDAEVFSSDYNDLTNKPTLFDGDYNSLTNIPAGSTPFSGDYNDLTNKPTLFDEDYNSLTNKPTLFDGDYNTLDNKPTLFDGDYDSLINKPTIPTVPTVGYTTKVLDDYVEEVSNKGTLSGTETIDPASGTIQYGTHSGDFTIAPSGWTDGQTVSLFASGSGTRTVSMSGAKFAEGNNQIVDDSIITITRVNGTYWVSISKGYA